MRSRCHIRSQLVWLRTEGLPCNSVKRADSDSFRATHNRKIHTLGRHSGYRARATSVHSPGISQVGARFQNCHRWAYQAENAGSIPVARSLGNCRSRLRSRRRRLRRMLFECRRATRATQRHAFSAMKAHDASGCLHSAPDGAPGDCERGTDLTGFLGAIPLIGPYRLRAGGHAEHRTSRPS